MRRSNPIMHGTLLYYPTLAYSRDGSYLTLSTPVNRRILMRNGLHATLTPPGTNKVGCRALITRRRIRVQLFHWEFARTTRSGFLYVRLIWYIFKRLKKILGNFRYRLFRTNGHALSCGISTLRRFWLGSRIEGLRLIQPIIRRTERDNPLCSAETLQSTGIQFPRKGATEQSQYPRILEHRISVERGTLAVEFI